MGLEPVDNYYKNKLLNEPDYIKQPTQNQQPVVDNNTNTNNQNPVQNLQWSGQYNKYVVQTKYDQEKTLPLNQGVGSTQGAGEEAAKRLLGYKVEGVPAAAEASANNAQTGEFVRVMEEHKGDQEYMKAFVGGIPPEKMAEFVSRSERMATEEGKKTVADGLATGITGVKDRAEYIKQFAVRATKTSYDAKSVGKVLERLPAGGESSSLKEAMMGELMRADRGLGGRRADSLGMWERGEYAQAALDLMSVDASLAKKYEGQKLELESNASYLKFKLDGGEVNGEGFAIDAKNGEEAAARLMNDENGHYIGPEKKNVRINDFTAAIEKHKDDPAFIAQMMKHLSAEAAAELISGSARQARGYRMDTDQEFDPRHVVVKGLSDAAKYMTGEELKAIGEAASKEPWMAMDVATLLSRDTSGGLTDLKRAVLEGLMMEGRALGNPGDDYLRQVDSYVYGRAAGKILGSDAKLAHEYLGKDGILDVNGQRGQFLRNATFKGANAGEVGISQVGIPEDLQRYDGLGSALGSLNQEDFKDVLTDEKALMPQLIETFKNEKVWVGGNNVYATDYGDLLKGLAGQTDANGNLTPEALKLFYENADRAAQDASVRDALSVIYARHTGQIMKDILEPEIGQSDGNRHQFEKFLHSVLFTKPENIVSQSQTTAFAQQAFAAYGGWMANIHSDLVVLDNNRFEQVHGQGWTRANGAIYLGRAMGLINGALEKAGQDLRASVQNTEWDIRNTTGVVAEVVLQGTGKYYGDKYTGSELLNKRNWANARIGVGLRILTSWVQTAAIDAHIGNVTEQGKQQANNTFQQALIEKYDGNIVSFIAGLNAEMEDALEPLNTNADGNLASMYKTGRVETVNDPYWESIFQN